MKTFEHTKVGIGQLNRIMLESVKSLASAFGLVSMLLPLLLGGGLMTLIMQRVDMHSLGFFLMQPAMLSVYAMMVINRLQLRDVRLPLIKDGRNLLTTILLGLLVTIAMLTILWTVRTSIPIANAQDQVATVTQSGIPIPSYLPPTSSVPSINSDTQQSLTKFEIYRVYFNVFSMASFSLFIIMPMIIMFIASVTRCNASLLSNLKPICMAVFRNTGLLVAVSLISFGLFVLWSLITVKAEWLIFTSVIPLTFLSSVIYRIALLALPNNTGLSSK